MPREAIQIKYGPQFDSTATGLSRQVVPSLCSTACPDDLKIVGLGQMLQQHDAPHFPVPAAPCPCRRKLEEQVREIREVWGAFVGRGVSAVMFPSQRVSLSSAVTDTLALPLLLAVVSSLRLIRGWWQGAVVLPGDLRGVMMEAVGQGPQEGGLLVVIPCYLCRGQLHPLAHTYTHTQTAAACSILCLPLGEKWEERSKQRGVFAQVHTAPHPSLSSPLSRLAEKTQSFLPRLSLSLCSSLPLLQSFPTFPWVYWSSLSSAQI